MKVGIVELAFHSEVLRSYINILKDITSDISCFTNKFCHDQVYDYQEDKAINWQLKGNETNQEYFTHNKELLSNCDAVIIVTLDDDLDFFSEYDWPTKTILLVHDYYSYFEPNQINYAGNLGEKARAAKSWLQYKSKSERRKTSKLIGQMTNLAVPSMAVMDFVKDRVSSSKLTEVLDFAIPNEATKVENESNTVISIPGNVISKSRNYHAVVNALKLIDKQIDKTELVILGQAKTSYGRKIIRELEKLQHENLKLKYYKSFIHQKEFDEQIRRSHFLLLPISKVMRYRHFKEMNGFTCVSGNINDMLYFGKPAIIPKFYPLDADYEQLVKRYDDEDHLSKILLNWINQKEFQKHSEELVSVQKKGREAVTRRFAKAIS